MHKKIIYALVILDKLMAEYLVLYQQLSNTNKAGGTKKKRMIGWVTRGGRIKWSVEQVGTWSWILLSCGLYLISLVFLPV